MTKNLTKKKLTNIWQKIKKKLDKKIDKRFDQKVSKRFANQFYKKSWQKINKKLKYHGHHLVIKFYSFDHFTEIFDNSRIF